MKVQAKAKFIRISPRKTRLVVDLIRGMSIDEARAQLAFSPKQAALPVLKTLNSAVANATNNNKMDPATLKIEQAFVDEGPTIHRFTPRAQGRATAIRKRMSHITIVVGDGKEDTTPKKDVAKKEEKKTDAPVEKKPAAKKTTKKPAAKKATADTKSK